ncbi:hypothetical protein [Paenarthrobacter sp. C1]|uniref:hypothetical protein n=1 Tax=Paenarthrobacter sp. C1 TaxID=3400220 RepID=UPI003BF56ED4
MSKKPLELTIYPEGGCEMSADCALRVRCVDCVEELDKRLDDAELAAEYHANESQAWRMFCRRPEFIDQKAAVQIEDREVILRRFITLPHYDEGSE